jgi:phosphoribosylamine--glycine ligase
MKVLVVGGGGREHAIIRKLKENNSIKEIHALPGNGGMHKDAIPVSIGAKDIDGIVKYAQDNKIDYAVVAPDDPLVLGCVNALEKVGIPAFGPRAEAAIIEGSKVFSKNLMKKYGIPTADYQVFSDANEALEYKDGYITIPDKPGLGIEINEEECLKHPYQVHTLRHYTGALTDIRPAKTEFYF